MKSLIKISAIFLLLCLTLSSYQILAQDTKKTETFKVYGNCDMCKETMEGALKKKDGVLKKDWNKKTKLMTLTYDESKINLTQIKQKLADVGYDTDDIQAKDEVYNKLHKCCHYKRAKDKS